MLAMCSSLETLVGLLKALDSFPVFLKHDGHTLGIYRILCTFIKIV